MRIPYFHILNDDEKDSFNYIMTLFRFKKLDCWELKAPDDFENHEPCDEMKKIGK